MHLHHAILPVRATEGGVLVADVLEGGVRGAVGVCAQAVPVVDHAIRLVGSTPGRRLPCREHVVLFRMRSNLAPAPAAL